MGYGLEAQVSIPGEGKIFLFFTSSTPDQGPIEDRIHLAQGTPLPLVKGLKLQASHLYPHSTEVKIGGTIHPISNKFS
jgi:hypothetical protein